MSVRRRKAERHQDPSRLRGGRATIGATYAVAEDSTPFFRYPVLAIVFLETHSNRYGSLATSRT